MDQYAYSWEQNRGSVLDSLKDWDGGRATSYTDTENSYKSDTTPPPLFPFIWVLVFILLQIYLKFAWWSSPYSVSKELWCHTWSRASFRNGLFIKDGMSILYLLDICYIFKM